MPAILGAERRAVRPIVVLDIEPQIVSNTWVAGYSNDVFVYIPSVRVLKEETIIDTVERLTAKTAPYTQSPVAAMALASPRRGALDHCVNALDNDDKSMGLVR